MIPFQQKPANQLSIEIRCAGAGKHQNMQGSVPLGPRLKKHWLRDPPLLRTATKTALMISKLTLNVTKKYKKMFTCTNLYILCLQLNS